MNNEQERIEEMAKDLEEARYYAMATVGSLNSGFGGWYGAYMYKKGYRKQSDTAREILQYLYEKMGNVSLSDTELVLYLAAQYGVEVEEWNTKD